MKITKYLKQTAQLEKRAAGNTAEGQAEYAAAITIKCRKEPSGKIIKDIEGQERKATTCYYTDTKITEEDRIDGKQVIQAEEYIGSQGTAEGYEVYV